jgi:hypothetical protein
MMGATRTLVYPLDGSAPHPIPGAKPAFRPVQWSEDSKAVYGYDAGELPVRVYKVDIATGRKTVLQELRPAAPAGVVNVAPLVVNHDATRFAYSYYEVLSVLYVISGIR